MTFEMVVKPPTTFELARRTRGLTQVELADVAGVSRAIITLCERHDYCPAPETQRRLADALGVEAVDLWPVEERAA